jgi:hypothetical protein
MIYTKVFVGSIAKEINNDVETWLNDIESLEDGETKSMTTSISLTEGADFNGTIVLSVVAEVK